jgi:hypothetical protein
VASFFKPVSSASSSSKKSKAEVANSESLVGSAVSDTNTPSAADPTDEVEASAVVTEISVSDAVVSISVTAVARQSDSLVEILSLIDESWRPALAKETAKPYFTRLEQFLNSEYKSRTIFPPISLLFTAFNLCPLHNVKGFPE